MINWYKGEQKRNIKQNQCQGSKCADALSHEYSIQLGPSAELQDSLGQTKKYVCFLNSTHLICLSVCLFVEALTSEVILPIVPACSSGTLTNVLPHWNAMTQTQDVAPYLITVYRHRADLPCYPLMWKVTLESTTISL